MEQRYGRNGIGYTLLEFCWWYGDARGLELWEEAAFRVVGGPSPLVRVPAGNEGHRIARDGGVYTLLQFLQWYGARYGWQLWQEAGCRVADAPQPQSREPELPSPHGF